MNTHQDFIDLNVPGLMRRYSNPSDAWHDIVRALASTQLRLFRQYQLINESAPALALPIEDVVVRFSDYTPLGQAFVMTREIDKWLASCDRRGGISAYQNPVPLERRITKFIGAQQTVPEDALKKRASER